MYTNIKKENWRGEDGIKAFKSFSPKHVVFLYGTQYIKGKKLERI